MNDQDTILRSILSGGPVKDCRQVNLENVLADPNAVNGTRFLEYVGPKLWKPKESHQAQSEKSTCKVLNNEFYSCEKTSDTGVAPYLASLHQTLQGRRKSRN